MSHPILTKNLYLASAGQAGMAGVANKFSDMLKASQVQGLDWIYENYPKETHASIYHPAALSAFRQLFASIPKPH
ncbi:MAG: hypothetical protein NTY70_10135 [Burkholderiales bacterium]|nr:hypothetical protein [Burkholderiales bacterium]